MAEAYEPISRVSSKPEQTRPSRAEYQRQRRLLLHDLYFKSRAEKEELRALASEDGYGHDFNAWLLLKIYASLSGSVYPAEYVEGLKAQLERVTTWHEAARDEAQAYRAEVKTLQQQKETLLFLLNGLPDGAEVATRWLEQQTRGQKRGANQ